MAEHQTMPAATDAAARRHHELATFFAPQRWRTPLPDFEHSGYALIEQVRGWRPRFVVDVGCGDNLFKGIELQLRHVASWLSPAGRIVMRAHPGLPTGPGLEFFPWSPINVDTIGATAGLRREGRTRYDTSRNGCGDDEPRLVWQYRLATAPISPAVTP